MINSSRQGLAAFVVHTPQTRLPLFYSFLARLPGAAIGILLPLLGLSSGMSATVSGLAFAICRLVQAFSGPFWGKVVDHFGLTFVVPVVGTLFGVTVTILSIITVTPISLLGLAGLIGLLTLPMNALMRALWNRALDSSAQKDVANAVESLMSELILLLGRVAVAVVAVVVSLNTIVAVQGVLAIAGSLGLATTALVRHDHASKREKRTTRSLDAVFENANILFCFLLLSASLGAYSMALLITIDSVFDNYKPTMSALTISIWGFGSVVGLTVGRLNRIAVNEKEKGCLILLLAMGCLQLLTSTGMLWEPLLLVAAFLAGLPISSVLTGLYALLGNAVASEHHTELFAWATTMIFAGDALGALFVGVFTDLVSTPAAALAVSCGAACLAAVTVGLRPQVSRITLTPPSDAPTPPT
ncbi:MFS transporter [Rhodococcus sp. UFZ-B548]|uniref:MFS transporter n=1 Tax=Rhodococcus sp. UFZ-B548 TaxID=2742212 RepID=UPI0037C6483D